MRKMSEKSGQKLNPLSRKSTFLNKNPKRIIFDAMILAMFGGGGGGTFIILEISQL